MIKPVELDSAEGNDIWDTLTAAADGDVGALRPLLIRNPRLARASYWYAPACILPRGKDTSKRFACCSMLAAILNRTA